MEFKVDRIGSKHPLEDAREEYYIGRYERFLTLDKS